MPKPTRVSGRDGSQESADPERSPGVSGAAVERWPSGHNQVIGASRRFQQKLPLGAAVQRRVSGYELPGKTSLGALTDAHRSAEALAA